MSKGNRTRRKEAGLLPASILCSARKKDGTPCKRSPIKGASVCRAHGGAAPQVVAAARRRLMEGSNQMAVLLLRIAEDESTPAAVRVAAIKDALDRAGVNTKTELEITVKPWQELIEGIVAEVDDDSIMRTSRVLARTDFDPTRVIPGEVADEDVERLRVMDPDPAPKRPAPTTKPKANGLVPVEPRIPSRRKKGKANISR